MALAPDTSPERSAAAAAGNGHLPSTDRAARSFGRRLDRNEWCAVAGALCAGCVLLSVATCLPQLWARQSGSLGDLAIHFVAVGLATLGAVFLPAWAIGWRAALTCSLAAAVMVLLAGLIEGSDATHVARIAIKLFALGAAFATIWILMARARQTRRLIWLALVFWALGVPLLGFQKAESGLDQDPGSTFLHCSVSTILR